MNSISRSILARSLVTGAASLAFMMMGPAVVRAQTVIGADGANGADCSDAFCRAENGGDGESVFSDGNPAAAIGGNGGGAGVSFSGPGDDGFAGAGGDATATSASSATATGGNGGPGTPEYVPIQEGGNGGNATATATGGAGSSATATGGNTGGLFAGAGNATATSSATATGAGSAGSSAAATGGDGGGAGPHAEAGNATATSSATAKGSGGATASATASGGMFTFNSTTAIATSFAETAEGGFAQAQSQAQADFSLSQATAKTTFGGVRVQSTVFLAGEPFAISTSAIAQGGSGQSSVDMGPFDALAFSTALPNTAYATALIGSASNVAGALLGSGDTIFGTAILGGIGGSSTFDFNFRGDLILGVITGGLFDIVANGIDILSDDGSDNSIINLGFLGPSIDLTIEGNGVFAVGGAVPETSTWAMMLIGFAGLGYAGYRRSGSRAARKQGLLTFYDKSFPKTEIPSTMPFT
jgi:hypothetical protein